ncbi:MAG: plasmid pRiA4b ORF-3 family protein [Pseudomonadota bacterium]|nr:plasmid pRiA4b ORF-3 family protein [Pseudomonadota bacterium]
MRLADFAIPYDAPLIIGYEYDFGDSWTAASTKARRL